MSYLRGGQVLDHFEGFSEAYIFPREMPDGTIEVEDYDFDYKDNSTFAELLVNIVLRETKDKDFAWKIAGVLEKKLRGVKRRKHPLTHDEYFELTKKICGKKKKGSSG